MHEKISKYFKTGIKNTVCTVHEKKNLCLQNNLESGSNFALFVQTRFMSISNLLILSDVSQISEDF